MTSDSVCPFGFEDGKIVAYRAESSTLQVDYVFWNELRGRLSFGGFVALRDDGAINVTIASLATKQSSSFLDLVVQRQFVQPPSELKWKSFQFLDLDDTPMFEVIAELYSFNEIQGV
jgi:hypothetical protein